MMAGILACHRGLEFLHETPEFQDRSAPGARHSAAPQVRSCCCKAAAASCTGKVSESDWLCLAPSKPMGCRVPAGLRECTIKLFRAACTVLQVCRDSHLPHILQPGPQWQWLPHPSRSQKVCFHQCHRACRASLPAASACALPWSSIYLLDRLNNAFFRQQILMAACLAHTWRAKPSLLRLNKAFTCWSCTPTKALLVVVCRNECS